MGGVKRLETNLEILKKLYAYQQYIQTCEKGIQIYGPGLYRGVLEKDEKYLKEPATHNVAKFEEGKCMLCGSPIPKNTEGDHLIAKVKGGDDYEYNKVPVCKSCNSSKKDKDLLEWWFSKGRSLKELNSYVLAVYLKNEYKLLEKKGELNNPAYPYLEVAWLHAQKILDYLFWRYSILLKNLGNNKFQMRVEEDEDLLEKRSEILEYLFESNIFVSPKTLEFLIFKGINYVKEHILDISSKFSFWNDNLEEARA